MADNTLESKNTVLPKDLVITSQPDSLDSDKFKVVASGLKIDKTYSFQFQYVYTDGTVSEWSPGLNVTTVTESIPAAPSASVPGSSVGSIPVTLNTFPTNAKRVDIYIIGGEFGTGKVADYFLSAGTKNISVQGGEYQVSLLTVTPSGVNGTPTSTFSITVSIAGETVEAPTNPNGFSINRILGGIEVLWAGTYVGNDTFTGFEAIKIYVGTSATATGGTYREAGVMTANNIVNSITVPVDGTYLRYNQPVYVHARAVNKDGVEGTLQQNVATNALGARSAVASDLADNIITNAKLVDDAVTAAKIATNAITEIKIDQNAITAAKIAAGAITETKIASDAITAPKIAAGAIEAGKIAAGAITAEKIAANAIEADKIAANAVTAAKIVANAITADKIVSSAITADKIATNAITATKIQAGEIDVTKLAANTISVDNLEAGTLKTTSYIRVGSKNIQAGTGSRIELSSANIEDGTSDIQAGFYIYNSAGSAILSAPIGGGLTINGGGTFSGNLSAAGGSFTGALTVGTTTVANITGASTSVVNSISRVTFTANNSLQAGDVVTISGIADNQIGTTPPPDSQPIFSPNPYNLGTVTVNTVTPTSFTVLSTVTGTYTSGGIVTAPAFRVSSTGILRAFAGNIGGWAINTTQLRSAAADGSNRSYISLEPATSKIAIVTGATFTNGVPSGGSEAISISATEGIKSSTNSFILSPNGNLSLTGTVTAGSGSTIGGWSITGNSIARSSSYTDWLGSTQTLTTTLGSNSTINLSSTSAPNAAINDISSVDNLVRVNHQNAQTVIGPGQLEIGTTATLFGIPATKIITWMSAGSDDINVKWSGGSAPKIRWWNYIAGNNQRTTSIFSNIDTVPENIRPIVVDVEGRQWLGPILYFSTTQTTTPAAGTGQNGDLYFSTA